VEFRNDSGKRQDIAVKPTVAGNAAVNLTLEPGAGPKMAMFRKPEVMMAVRGSAQPGDVAFVNISPTPFFAVTGTDGSFKLQGLPAGEYTLGLVQEKMGERDVQVTVKPQLTVTADVSFTP
jgi:hypothetical protein